MESTVGGVAEELQQDVGGRDGRFGPAGLAGGLTQPGQTVHHCSVVGGVAERPGSSVGLPGAQPPTVGASQRRAEEVGVGPGRLHPVLATSCHGRIGQGGKHQAVPLGQDLVVQAGTDAGLASGKECLTGAFNGRRALQVATDRPVDDVGSLEVSALGNPVPVFGHVGVVTAHGSQLAKGPHVERALHPFGVGVLRREEPAIGVAEVPQHVLDGLRGDLAPPFVPEHPPPVQVDPGQEGVVVEHLLEVGDHPAGVHRVAREATAEVVVHAPRRHGVERGGDHLDGPGSRSVVAVTGGQVRQEGLEAHGLGELGRAPEPAPLVIVLPAQLIHRPGQCVRRWQVLAGGEVAVAGHGGRQPVTQTVEVVAPGRPGLRHGAQDLRK